MDLSADEQKLFGLFKNALNDRHDIVLRVAGGWVRDKLMGVSSHDIDIVVQGLCVCVSVCVCVSMPHEQENSGFFFSFLIARNECGTVFGIGE